jgi:hypothetical protein
MARSEPSGGRVPRPERGPFDFVNGSRRYGATPVRLDQRRRHRRVRDPLLRDGVYEASTGARATTRVKGADVDAAVPTALRETVFRFELVLRIIVTTHELLEREVLIEAALAAHLALLANEGRAETGPSRCTSSASAQAET